MSRTKKSRKPGASHFTVATEDNRINAEPAPRKPKKKSGKRPGNRQQEAIKKSDNKQTTQGKKDPRIGSKKPIVLGKTSEPAKKVAAAKNQSPAVAPIRYVESQTPSKDELMAELYAIEDNEQLQAILAKQNDEIALTEAEVDLFNEKMARHEEISTLLGLDDDELEDDSTPSSNSEDELWDKLDNSDISSFE